MKLAIVLLALAAIGPAAAKPLKGSRPNIILVMTDDQGMGDLSCMGNPILKTPNLDKFYAKSTRFTEFHVSPTCAPTRSALMSGRHPMRNGVTHTIKERELMALSTTTFPQLLRKAGYETGIFGKWHLGDPDEYQPYSRGFSETFIHGAGGIGQAYEGSCADFPPNQEKEGRYFDNAILHNDTIVKTKGFCRRCATKSSSRKRASRIGSRRSSEGLVGSAREDFESTMRTPFLGARRTKRRSSPAARPPTMPQPKRPRARREVR